MDFKLFEVGKKPSDQLNMTEEEIKANLTELSAVAQAEYDRLVANIKALQESDLEHVGVLLLNWAIQKGTTPAEWTFYGAKASTGMQLVAEGLKKATMDSIMQEVANSLKDTKTEPITTVPGPAKGD